MGRNFYSLCDKCKVQLMHFRGKESKTLHRFADDHLQHKEFTRIVDDYVEEPPDNYDDVFDTYHDKEE